MAGMEVSLEGKVAIVTGAGPNIGSGIALALARYGAKVACNDLDPAAAQASVDRITRHGHDAFAIPGDVTDEDAVRGYVDEVVQRYGRLDIVINNAAILGGRPMLLESLEFFNRAIEVAAAGTFLNSKYGAIAMIEREIKGSIVNILSSNAWQGAPGVCAYAFHKGGMANFTRACAMELAPYGIRVNSYSPTAPRPDNPEMLRAGRSFVAPDRGGERPAWWKDYGKIDVRGAMPMMPSTPTDIGHCVAWVVSDYARLITGCDFVIDGGARAKYWAYTPPEEKAEPIPLVPLYEDETMEGGF